MKPLNTEIPEDLKRIVKSFAAKEGKTFKQVVIEALTERVKNEVEKSGR